MDMLYDIREIMNLLPHRYPFILVDRILEMIPDERVVGLKNVTMNEPFFQGHFPGTPVMPGVLIIEAMAQVGGILAYSTIEEAQERPLIYFMGIDKARFRKPVVPGDQILFEVKLLQRRSKLFKMAGKATVEGAVVAEAEVMAMTEDKP
jgi:beta-hydroxyacyl-ACP dehydratase FabZ